MIPSNLVPPRDFLSNPATPWHVSPRTQDRLQAVPGGAYSTCEITPQSPEWPFIRSYFEISPPINRTIKRATYIRNSYSSMAFEAAIPGMEQQASRIDFAPKWRQEGNLGLRKKTMDRFNKLAANYVPFSIKWKNERHNSYYNVKVLPMWQGSKALRCRSICETGFTYFGKHEIIEGKGKPNLNTDIGYFGSGIYFTTSARYAADVYSDGNILLAWVALREPFPVVADKSYPSKPSDMERLEGRGAYQNYNAHYIPVVAAFPNSPSCSIYYPCMDHHEPDWDELILFQPNQTLLCFWLELDVSRTIDPSNFDFPLGLLANKISELLEDVEVQKNAVLREHLKQKSKVINHLISQSSDKAPMGIEERDYYVKISRLISVAGKVRPLALEQLGVSSKLEGVSSPAFTNSSVGSPVKFSSSSSSFQTSFQSEVSLANLFEVDQQVGQEKAASDLQDPKEPFSFLAEFSEKLSLNPQEILTSFFEKSRVSQMKPNNTPVIQQPEAQPKVPLSNPCGVGLQTGQKETTLGFQGTGEGLPLSKASLERPTFEPGITPTPVVQQLEFQSEVNLPSSHGANSKEEEREAKLKLQEVEGGFPFLTAFPEKPTFSPHSVSASAHGSSAVIQTNSNDSSISVLAESASDALSSNSNTVEYEEKGKLVPKPSIPLILGSVGSKIIPPATSVVPKIIPQALPSVLSTQRLSPEDYPLMAFGAADWEKYFGDVGVEPPLPVNIQQILSSPCPFWPDKLIAETCFLTLISSSIALPVGGMLSALGRARFKQKYLTLNLLSSLIKSPKQGLRTTVSKYGEHIQRELGNKQFLKSYWVLMTKEVIPGSRSLSYEQQLKLVASYREKTEIPYEPPSAFEAAVSIFMDCIKNRKTHYTDDKLGVRLTYTRCRESVDYQRQPVIVGGYSKEGLEVDCDFGHGSTCYGMAGLWKL